MSNPIKKIGILGAGKLGIVVAQLLTKAGYTVAIAGSGDPDKIALTVKVLVPGAEVASKEAVAATSDVVILAVPLGKYQTLPVDALKGKLVIDAMNYWWEVDGERPEFTQDSISTSEIIQAYLPESRVVKAFSHIGYHELFDETRPEGAPDRIAMAIAGDNSEDIDTVAELVNKAGFDPVYIGELAKGRILQPHEPLFGVHTGSASLKALVEKTRLK